MVNVSDDGNVADVFNHSYFAKKPSSIPEMPVKKYNRAQYLLNILSNGRFHSGESLGESLGITRSAVWKMIQRLQDRGIAIQSVNGKGYRIANGLSLLNEIKILQQIAPEFRGKLNELICFDQIDSTNDYLLKQVNPQQARTMACFAEQQTAGKGRRSGRSWLSPYANNIYHSLLWYFEKDASELVGLSLAVAVMVARALRRFGIERQLELKWPNDILWRSQKLCGILVELLAEPHQTCAVVIGIGINTRLTIQQSLNRPITSTEDILNEPTDRNQLAATLLNELIPGMEEFQKNGLKSFMNEWQSLDSFKGRMVRLKSSQQEIIGLARGISERGELLLEDAHGCVTNYLSGEVSLRTLKE